MPGSATPSVPIRRGDTVRVSSGLPVTIICLPLPKATGLPLHIHDLRYSCAAWLVSVAVVLWLKRGLLGNAAVTMMEKYVHLELESVRSTDTLPEGTQSRLGKVAEEKEKKQRAN